MVRAMLKFSPFTFALISFISTNLNFEILSFYVMHVAQNHISSVGGGFFSDHTPNTGSPWGTTETSSNQPNSQGFQQQQPQQVSSHYLLLTHKYSFLYY